MLEIKPCLICGIINEISLRLIVIKWFQRPYSISLMLTRTYIIGKSNSTSRELRLKTSFANYASEVKGLMQSLFFNVFSGGCTFMP